MTEPSEVQEADTWPPNTPLHNLACLLAKAHDQNVSERETGAENAYRAASGIAVPYWNALAGVALSSGLKIVEASHD